MTTFRLIMSDLRQNMWTVNEDGSNRVDLANKGHSPSWTPDGRIIYAYTLKDANGGVAASSVWVGGRDGRSFFQLGPTFTRNLNRPMMSSNGLIVFDQMAPGGGDDVMLMDPYGNCKTVVPGGMQPCIAGSGNWMVWVRQTEDPRHRQVWRSNIDGTNAVQLTAPYDAEYQDCNAPAISPDEQQVAMFSGLEADVAGAYPWGNIAITDQWGHDRRVVTACAHITHGPPDPAGSCRAADNPFWYPDGRQVGFDRGSANAADSGTGVVDISTGAARMISPEPRGGGIVPVREAIREY